MRVNSIGRQSDLSSQRPSKLSELLNPMTQPFSTGITARKYRVESCDNYEWEQDMVDDDEENASGIVTPKYTQRSRFTLFQSLGKPGLDSSRSIVQSQTNYIPKHFTRHKSAGQLQLAAITASQQSNLKASVKPVNLLKCVIKNQHDKHNMPRESSHVRSFSNIRPKKCAIKNQHDKHNMPRESSTVRS